MERDVKQVSRVPVTAFVVRIFGREKTVASTAEKRQGGRCSGCD